MMTKYALLRVALGIVVSIACVQCKNPATPETEVTTQKDSISGITSEPNTYIDSIEIKKYRDSSEATVIDNTITTTAITPQPKVFDKPKTSSVNTTKPINSDKPKPTTSDTSQPIVIDKPITTTPEITQETPVEKPAALVSANFTLQSVKATIKGTSTMHDWESKITIMEGKGSFQLKDNKITSIKNAEIKIAVKGIISEKGKKMDNKTYETFKSDEYPNIIYTFNNAVIKIDDSNVASMETSGKLSMAGASKTVSILAKGKELPNGDLQLTVSKIIKMTDFDMEPPVMFLGTIKVGDEITVTFDFILTQSHN